MSDDTEDTSPIIIGDPLTPEEMSVRLSITAQDLDDAVDWWDSVASDLFVGVLE